MVQPIQIPLGSLDSRSNPVREFGQAQDLQNMDFNILGEPERRKGYIKRLDSTYDGPVRLLFAYGGLCGRFPQLAGGGKLITVTQGGTPDFGPAGSPGVYGEDPQPSTPVEEVAALSDLVVAQTNSVGIEWRYSDGTKTSPFGAQYVLVLRRDGTPPESPTDENATEVFRGLGFNATDTSKVAPGGTFYRAWVKYASGFSEAKDARILSGVWFVDVNADAGGNGLSWGTAFQHPQDAADAMSSSDSIWIAAGDYTSQPASDRLLEFLSGTTGVLRATVLGGFVGDELIASDRNIATNTVTFDGQDVTHNLIYFDGDNIAVSGLTLVNANANHATDSEKTTGGAINLYHATGGTSVLSVSDCIITDNASTGNGAAVYVNLGAAVSVVDTEFKRNTTSAGRAGALWVKTGAVLSVSGCDFEDNSCGGGFGGAVLLSSGGSVSALIATSTFTRNTSGGAGGAMELASPCEVSDCEFTGNSSASSGGAIDAFSGTGVHITDCEFTSNVAASSNGGGAANMAEVVRCTFTGNSVTSGNGGGLTTLAGAEVSDSVFTSNTVSGLGGGALLNSGSSVTGSRFTSNVAGNNGGGIYDSAGNATLSGNTFSGNTPNDVGTP